MISIVVTPRTPVDRPISQYRGDTGKTRGMKMEEKEPTPAERKFYNRIALAYFAIVFISMIWGNL